MFLAIFQVLECVFLIFPRFSVFLPYSRFYSVYISFSTIFQCFLPYSRSYQLIFSISELVSFLDIFQVLQCTFLIFHIFHCFLPYSRSYSVCLIFHVFKFSGHISGPAVCISHFSRFSLFLPIFKVLQCVYLIFHDFQCFLPYS